MRFVLSIVLALFLSIVMFELIVDKRVAIPVKGMDGISWGAPIPIWKNYPKSYSFKKTHKEYIKFPTSTIDIKIEYQFDQYGGRHIDKSSINGANKTVLIIGDSFSYGAETKFDKTLQGRLSSSLHNVNIVSAAIRGTNSSYYPQMAKEYLRGYPHPVDIAIVGLYVDPHIGDIPRQLARESYGDYHVYRGYTVGPTRSRILKHSAFNRNWFKFQIDLRRYSSTYNTIFPPKIIRDFAVDISQTLAVRNLESLAEKTIKNLDNLRKELAQNKIIVWLIPSSHYLYSRYNLKISPTYQITPYWHRNEVLWSKIKHKLKNRGYNVVDSRTHVHDTFLKRAEYPFTLSGHLNSAGYTYISKQIEDVVKKLLTERQARH